MDIGYIGLGKMGSNMVERLLEYRHHVVVYDENKKAAEHLAWKGAEVAQSIWNIADILKRPRVVWLMVPHDAVDSVLTELVPKLHEKDTIIDGGNSFYKETQRRSVELEKKDILFLDAGVSGGPRGAREGACIMVGGDEDAYKEREPLFRDIAAPGAYAYFGAAGAGHFVKMVHNGIEYGMMQSLAEGFTILKKSPYALPLGTIADLYNHRSVIESRLVGWLKDAFEQYGEDLQDISGSVSQSGEGLWTVDIAKEMNIPIPIIERSVEFRKESQENPSYTGKILSAMRGQFGGHDVAI